ncbi:dioxygenase [Pseudogemmobacter faecipullorum]|uniref:Hydroxyquinol 1,2-dioxygenase n=1 Tax=Pseudogemmobacter faecipullorum TaxID=2755041 RepID=A0ABS8CNH4_9RHOB|nr:dioxygenase [Pseudogemmobacter faecipullorum]MCB5410922.1 hydroxyquinol 1,2-dioxygenase [Pseudogemmobacter faecipullorum]
MSAVSIDTVTDVVIAALGKNGPITDRNRVILTALIRHIHDFAREVKLQHDEFLFACDFLARAGQLTDDKRQEFILLSDIIGLEVLVDMLSHGAEEGASESTVLGPFYRENPPVLPKGATISQMHFDNEETIYFEGHVRDTNGNPIEGVLVDVWEDAPNGLYENHDPNQPDYNLRGRLTTDANGHYAFRAVLPVAYPIPDDHTAGELIRAMGHHPMRPSHMHFMLQKDGYKRLISQVFDSRDKYLENDSVFAVKESLIGTYTKAAPELEVDLQIAFDFTLSKA